MNLKLVLERFRGESKLNELARDVAERCRHDVWDKVWRRVPAMETAEARGYVRARAAIVVSREVDWVADHSKWVNGSRRQRLFDQTLTNVTQLIVAAARAVHVAPARRAA
jgi:hypothetical protein